MGEIYVNSKARLDQILSNELNISRNKASNLIKNGEILVEDKKILKSSFEPNLGDKITFNLNIIQENKVLEKKDIDIKVIYEDSEILVVNKPSNLVVHGANSVKEYSLVDYLKEQNYTLSNKSSIRSGVVHRLDKGTSGVLVLAKTDNAKENLSAQFKNRTTDKIYLALTDLALKESVVIDRPIGRNPKNRLKKAIINDGRESKSAFTNIFTNDKINLIAAKIYTGRTHQIRVHLNSINRHIIGDDLYGFKRKSARITTLMLHSYILSFNHPKSGDRLTFVADLDGEFKRVINKENVYEKVSPNFVISSFEHVCSWVCLN